jgi:hypothetical protein
MADYPVKKISHQQMPTPGPQGGNTDIRMKNPARVGPAHNPASNPDLQESFDSEKDFGTIARARSAIAAIKSNPARYKAAMEAGVRLQNAGGKVNEIKGANNKGVRTHANNEFDRRASGMAKPLNGQRDDGGRGRW